MKRFTQLRLIVWLRRHQKALAVMIITASLLFLAVYTILHPSVVAESLRINPIVLGLLLVLYVCVLVTQFIVMSATIRLCRKQLPAKNGLLLSIYSTLINFFGPLQSGPGVRAIYLKQKIGLRIRDYAFITMFYYFAFAAINGSLLFINTLPILTLLGLVASVGLTAVGVRRFKLGGLSRFVVVIFLATVVQILLMTTIFFIELHAIHPTTDYSFLQTFVYSASANLSLFVSITPGAIGIREAFIVFAQSLHHIPLGSIISAGVLDRTVYVLLLILLFIASSGLHLKDMFTQKKTTKVG
ncbi:MAG: hypothetical protein ABI716_02970 [Candidatus Saccharibacteria bacterium]